MGLAIIICAGPSDVGLPPECHLAKTSGIKLGQRFIFDNMKIVLSVGVLTLAVRKMKLFRKSHAGEAPLSLGEGLGVRRKRRK
jgi:hypothetical protein